MTNFKLIEQACKLIDKYALKELTIHPDGTITIVKEMHAPKVKQSIQVKPKPPPSPPLPENMPEVDLALVAARLPTPGLNNHTRLKTKSILPNQGKE